MPPRITRKSNRRKVSDRTMVGTAQPVCLSALGTGRRRYESTMNLRKRKNHSVSLHHWGWAARPLFRGLTVAREVFVLTSPFIERRYRKEGIKGRPHDDKRTSRDLARATAPQSKLSDVERVRLASICAVNSATLCSAVAMASAPAINRRGGGCWSAITISVCASLAGSPDCLPFWAFQNSSCFVLRSS